MGPSEKRNAPRIIVDLVSVEIDLASPGKAHAGFREVCTVRNISETGMLFEADMAFAPGELMQLTFALPESPVVIRTGAVVVHAQKKKKFEIGVRFHDLAMTEQKLLHHFICKPDAVLAR